MASKTPVHPASWLIDRSTPASGQYFCPRCAGRVYRIRRRPLDRVLSILIPVRRYRCSARGSISGCTWEGVLRSGSAAYRKSSAEPAGDFGEISLEDMAQITLDSIGDAVVVVNPQGKITYLNKVAEALTGWPRELAAGCSVEKVFSIVNGKTRKQVTCPSQRAIAENRVVELALGSVLIRRDGTEIAIEDSAAPIQNHQGRVVGAVVVFHDARLSHSVIEEMSRLAQHDFLTGLPNRVLLMERLTQAIGMANRHNKQVALLFLDLDNFKKINDTLGHSMGDQLLQEVTGDLTTCVRVTDTVSRHGGDEFLVLLSEIESMSAAAQVAEKMLARISRSRTVNDHMIQVTLSIGISMYPDNGSNAEALMANADRAMYAAKQHGRNSYQFA